MTRRGLVLVCLCLSVVTAACGGGSSPAAPSGGNASSTPTRVIVLGGNLSFGAVTLNTTASGLLTVTNTGNSVLTFSAVSGICASFFSASPTSGTVAAGATVNVTMKFTPTTVTSCSGNITVTSDATSGTNTIPISASGTANGLPLFSQSGSGDNTFTVPSYVTKLSITGSTSSSCQNFIVHISTSVISLVNVIIGTCSVADTKSPFTGTYAISGGGTVTITSSTGINWTFTEVRN